MEYSGLILQNKQYLNLKAELQANANSHAYLFVSPDSMFLTEFCYMVASLFTGADINRIKKNIHPDVFIYGTTKTDVDDINQIIDSLFVAPYEAKYKGYVLLNFNDINETCQNKLLKSLEEPPKNVIFILSSSNTKKTLSTVLSRTKQINVDGITASDIYSLLTKSGVSDKTAKVAVGLCGGNSTLAQKFTSDRFINMYEMCLDILQNVNSSKDCLKYASMVDDKTDKSEMLDVIISLVRDIMVILSGNDNLVLNTASLSRLKVIANGFTLKCCSQIISHCLQLKEDLQYNANNLAVLDNLLLNIAQEKVKCRKL